MTGLARLRLAGFGAALLAFAAGEDAAGAVESSTVSVDASAREGAGYSPRVSLASRLAISDGVSGTDTALVPRVSLAVPLDPAWQLELDLGVAILYSPDGEILNPRTGETSRDDVPRMGNPIARLRHGFETALGRASLSLGFAFPMASVQVPTPATGQDFRRAPHTRSTYAQALSAGGYTDPWAYSWHTATVLAGGRIGHSIRGLVLGADLQLGLLLPAGRLRKDVGLALDFRLSGGYPLGDFEPGVEVAFVHLPPQRDDYDGSLELGGSQVSVAPRLRWAPSGPLFVEGAVSFNLVRQMEPEPVASIWNLSLEVGARL